ncbi:MAG: pantoate--beta-alanine ligase [Candidatus Thermochlorobacter sp.]
MQLIENPKEMQRLAETLRLAGYKIGFVPTMGALHAGHLSLVKIAKAKADKVVMSIFVNPLQFAPHEDFSRYPRPFERDVELATQAGVDVLFHPTMEQLYGERFESYVTLERTSQGLEGEVRPTHFRGVATVVTKLFNITKPHFAVFGEKDAQQLSLVKNLVRDLNFDIEILAAPIVRETDGLAMSSRNVYLSAEERQQATALYKSLKLAETKIAQGERNTHAIERMVTEFIMAHAALAKVEYVAVVNAENFQRVEQLRDGQDYYLLIAARFSNVRLLDNLHIWL